jgi:hypothetical protein
MLNFAHSGGTGDIIYSLYVIKKICEEQNCKANLYLKRINSFNYVVDAYETLNKLINSRNLNRIFNRSISYQYILDELSTNTAENFYRTSKHLNATHEDYDDIYIITSRFHHNRANLMMTLIDPSRSYNWILGNLQQQDSTHWETIHIKNVHNDVNKLSSIKF